MLEILTSIVEVVKNKIKETGKEVGSLRYYFSSISDVHQNKAESVVHEALKL